MNKRCWYNLGLAPGSMTRPEFKFPEKPEIVKSWDYKPEDVLKVERLEELRARNFKPLRVMLFYKKAFFSHTYGHLDMLMDTGLPNTYALNWVVGGKNSVMRWYERPATPPDVSEYKGLIDSSYIQWPITELKLIDEAHIQEPTLVRVNVPHSLHCGNEERWCFSLRIEKEDALGSWEQACARHGVGA